MRLCFSRSLDFLFLLALALYGFNALYDLMPELAQCGGSYFWPGTAYFNSFSLAPISSWTRDSTSEMETYVMSDEILLEESAPVHWSHRAGNSVAKLMLLTWLWPDV